MYELYVLHNRKESNNKREIKNVIHLNSRYNLIFDGGDMME